MSHAEPKRHHFIPEMLQKRFVNNNGGLYYFQKDQPTKIVPTKIGNIFVQGHLYAHKNENNEKELSLEKFYSKLEGYTDPVFNDIEEGAQEGGIIKFNEGARKIISAYVYNQLRRAPDFHRQVSSNAMVEGHLLKLMAQYRETEPDQAAEIEKLAEKDQLKRLVHNARVGALKTSTNEVQKILYDMSICVAHIQENNKSFVIGSLPIARFGSANLTDKKCEVWMPISSKVALGYVWGNPHENRVLSMDADSVRRMNMIISAQSSSFAAGSERLVRSLANRH